MNELQLHDPFLLPDPDMLDRGAGLPRVIYAYEMHLAGVDWELIAEKLGYASSDSAKDAVIRHIRNSYRQEDVDALVNTELARLDRLQLICWAQAKNGELKAIQQILNIMAMRMKLLGTEKKANESGTSIQNAAFFIGGSPEEYNEALARAREAAGVKAIGE